MAKILLKNKKGSLIYLEEIIYARKTDEDNLLELQLNTTTEDNHDVVYIKGLSKEEINETIENMFKNGAVNLSDYNVSILFDSDTIEDDQEDFDIDTLEDIEDDDDEENEEDEYINTDNDCEYKNEYSKKETNYDIDGDKKLGFFRKHF